MSAKSNAPLFILVDQSIQGPGGHHFEYAERILNAARAQGHRTLLLAHASYDAKAKSEHEVRPVFTRTFWENFGSSGQPQHQSANRVKRLRDWWRLRKIQWQYGQNGYYGLWAIEALYGAVAGPRTPVLPPDKSAFKASLVLAYLRVIQLVPKLAIVRYAIAVARPIFVAIVAVIAGTLGLVAASFAFVWKLVVALLRPANPAVSLFEKELAAGVNGLSPDELGYVFVPTLHVVELEGIRRFLSRSKNLSAVRWGLLYRRNIFEGFPDEYARQIENIRPLKYELERCRLQLGLDTLEFFTDTEELTHQYNQLNIFKFKTLPVPSDFTIELRERNRKSACQSHALRLTYLGDARDEKGYPKLLDVQKALRSSHIETGRVRLVAQSNFNSHDGDPATATARRLLRDCNSEGVELVYGPLDRPSYQALIGACDVMLVPYSQRNYAARSSGVFAEAVAAGIPAVVPSGTWMGNVVEPYRQRHLAALFCNDASVDAPIKQLGTTELSSKLALSGLFVPLPSEGTCGIVRITTAPTHGLMLQSDIVLLSASGVPLGHESQTIFPTGEETRVLFKFSGAAKAWVRIKVSSPSPHSGLYRFDLDTYATREGVPTDFGVVVYGMHPNAFVDAVREAVENYDHYSHTAASLARELREIFDPEVLVGRLSVRGADRYGAIAGSVSSTDPVMSSSSD